MCCISLLHRFSKYGVNCLNNHKYEVLSSHDQSRVNDILPNHMFPFLHSNVDAIFQEFIRQPESQILNSLTIVFVFYLKICWYNDYCDLDFSTKRRRVLILFWMLALQSTWTIFLLHTRMSYYIIASVVKYNTGLHHQSLESWNSPFWNI